MSHQFTNPATTNPSVAITAIATSIQVVSALGFPILAPFHINVSEGNNHELMQVNSGAGTTTWVVTRTIEAIQGVSTAFAFSTAATVDHVLTAAGLLFAVTENSIPRATVKNPITGAYTIVLADAYNTILADPTGGSFVITVPAASGLAKGLEFPIKQVNTNANVVTLNPTGADTFDGQTTYPMKARQLVILQCLGSLALANGETGWILK